MLYYQYQASPIASITTQKIISLLDASACRKTSLSSIRAVESASENFSTHGIISKMESPTNWFEWTYEDDVGYVRPRKARDEAVEKWIGK